MSGQELILRGEVVDERAERIAVLEAEVTRLRRELTIANGEIARAKAEGGRALAALRKQLSPLYRALQAVFGELDAAGAGDDAPDAPEGKNATVWAQWKQRLGGSAARVIDALQMHGELNTTQLAIAAGMDKRTVSNAIYKMTQASLINKNNGRFSLKQL